MKCLIVNFRKRTIVCNLKHLQNNISYKGVGKKFVDRFEQTSIQKIADMAAGAVIAYGVAKGGFLLKQHGPTLLNNLRR